MGFDWNTRDYAYIIEHHTFWGVPLLPHAAAARRRHTPPPHAAAAAQIGIYKGYITKILFSFFHCIVHYVESLIKENNAQTMTHRRKIMKNI